MSAALPVLIQVMTALRFYAAGKWKWYTVLSYASLFILTLVGIWISKGACSEINGNLNSKESNVCLRVKMCKRHFYDSTRKYVAMVTAYYGQKWYKACVANSSISFWLVFMKFGKDVHLMMFMCKAYILTMAKSALPW